MARESKKDKKARLALEEKEALALKNEETLPEPTEINSEGANDTITTDADLDAEITTDTVVIVEEIPEEKPEEKTEAEKPTKASEPAPGPEDKLELRSRKTIKYTFVPRGTAPNGFKQMAQLLFDVIGIELYAYDDEEGAKRVAKFEAWNAKNSRYGKLVKDSEVK